MSFFFNEFVENLLVVESSLKDVILLLETRIEQLNEEIEIQTVNKNMACNAKEETQE